MAKLKLYIEKCKACGYCVPACPKDAISQSDKFNKKGFLPNTLSQVDINPLIVYPKGQGVRAVDALIINK
ncbi:NADH:ubiquinone oxidoreductase chain I-like protein [Desulfosporosinus orientis DSM 765]|uniref:NADH:ubiquinone oxidoreductase chain I-like protein n=1 Tax=Desulfosporosinus orientis (strain ATCC 19365 / DSM 765 / NCIMB 8382 / VKM B-1628 / Singapore I) TaxID=768706 RepID=G7WAM3_DESOD|nr:4Fe-4S binding protein [Desulfosporosinus orientis]AET66791.1 NADH:ubiquinone oxidoreductase chain I-like protein [Desulfosporosinus orientis DSM 765]